MNRLFIEDGRPPIYVSAGFQREQAQIESLAVEEALAMQILGSFSMYENPGAQGTVFHWDSANQAAYNSVQLRNPGRSAAEKYLPDCIKKMHDYGQLALISVVALPGENPKIYLPELVEWALKMGADGVEADMSCPTIDLEKLCDNPMLVGEICDEIRVNTNEDTILSIKVSPLPSNTIDGYEYAGVGADYIDMINSKQVFMPQDPDSGKPLLDSGAVKVGMSGPAIRDLALKNLMMWRAQTTYNVLSVGGITDGHDVYDRIHLWGADMAGLGQAFERAHDKRRFIQRIASEYIDALDE